MDQSFPNVEAKPTTKLRTLKQKMQYKQNLYSNLYNIHCSSKLNKALWGYNDDDECEVQRDTIMYLTDNDWMAQHFLKVYVE